MPQLVITHFGVIAFCHHLTKCPRGSWHRTKTRGAPGQKARVRHAGSPSILNAQSANIHRNKGRHPFIQLFYFQEFLLKCTHKHTQNEERFAGSQLLDLALSVPVSRFELWSENYDLKNLEVQKKKKKRERGREVDAAPLSLVLAIYWEESKWGLI